MTFASESGHWYTRAGAPAYTIIGTNGKTRNTTLRDARKLDLLPSVTTIIGCAAAPALEYWKQTQVLHAALTLPTIPGESEKSFLYRIWEDSRAQGAAAAARGTAIHAAIEKTYSGFPPSEAEAWREHVSGAMGAVAAWVGEENPQETRYGVEKSFAADVGYGGKCDLHGDLGAGWVLDFKTKEFSESEAPGLKLYDNHAMQLAAYRYGLGYPHARCAICFVSATVPGLSTVIEVPADDLDKAWLMFKSLLNFWSVKNER